MRASLMWRYHVIRNYEETKVNEVKHRKKTKRSALFQHFKFALSIALTQCVCAYLLVNMISLRCIQTSSSSLRCFQKISCVPLQFYWTHFRHEWAYKSEWIPERWLHHIVPSPWCMSRFPISFDWKQRRQLTAPKLTNPISFIAILDLSGIC